MKLTDLLSVPTGTPEQIEAMQLLQLTYAQAMWEWADLESHIFSIYIAAVHGFKIIDEIDALQAAFFSVNSFEMRLTMTHAAMKVRFQKQPIWQQWTALQDRCRIAQRQRGKIAHKCGMLFPPQKPHQKEIAVLVDPIWHNEHPLSWGKAKSVGYDSSKLFLFYMEWFGINRDLAAFRKDLWKPELQLAFSPQPVDLLPLPHTEDNQTPKESLSPPEPSPA